MKINGIVLVKPKPQVLVIPMGDAKFVLKAKYVENYEGFDKIVPAAVAPEILKPKTGERYIDYKDKKYLEQESIRSQHRYDWIYLESLSATEGLEWATVDLADPTTWCNWRQDLIDGGMPTTYIARIIDLVNTANGFNTELLDEATQSFLASTQEK